MQTQAPTITNTASLWLSSLPLVFSADDLLMQAPSTAKLEKAPAAAPGAEQRSQGSGSAGGDQLSALLRQLTQAPSTAQAGLGSAASGAWGQQATQGLQSAGEDQLSALLRQLTQHAGAMRQPRT